MFGSDFSSNRNDSMILISNTIGTTISVLGGINVYIGTLNFIQIYY